MTAGDPPTTADLEQLRAQLGRPLRGVRAIVFRCRSGHPGVVETSPRLPDGTPFPTLFYLTCPSLSAAIGRLESSGLMRDWTDRLAADPELARAYRRAHERYLRRREDLEHVPEIAGVSAGGMPDRVKCLHALAAHALAEGPGVNPLGDEVLALLAGHPCLAGHPDLSGHSRPAGPADLADRPEDPAPGDQRVRDRRARDHQPVEPDRPHDEET